MTTTILRGIALLCVLAPASALAPGAAPLRAPAAARLRAQRLGPVRACDDAVDDDAAEEGADPFELPVMKMKRLVTPAQAGYERMRERQKQRRDAANGAPKPAPEPHVLGSDPVEGDAFVARLELSMYEKDGRRGADREADANAAFESFKAALAVDDGDISDGELQP